MILFVLTILLGNICFFKEVSSAVYKIDDESIIISKKFYDYDALILAQAWPQSSCWSLNHKWEAQSCNFCNYAPKSSDSSWTIHGLWPTSFRGKHPSFCDKTHEFDSSLLDGDLRAKLKEKWPTFSGKMSNLAFWKHEWSKHGTCASNIESTNSLPKYFSKSIELLDAYNVGEILKLFGIIPRADYEYNVKDIVGVIENFLEHRISITCVKNEINQKNYLQEIYICFDKSFYLIDCEGKRTIGCRGNQVIYPEILKPCK